MVQSTIFYAHPGRLPRRGEARALRDQFFIAKRSGAIKNSRFAAIFSRIRPLPWAGAQDFKAVGRDGPHGRFYSFAMQSYKK